MSGGFAQCGAQSLVELTTSEHVRRLNPCAGYNDVGMNEQDTIESFNYVINKCVEFGIGYVQLVRYVRKFLPVLFCSLSLPG